MVLCCKIKADLTGDVRFGRRLPVVGCYVQPFSDIFDLQEKKDRIINP